MSFRRDMERLQKDMIFRIHANEILVLTVHVLWILSVI